MSDYLIKGETLTNLSNAIRTLSESDATMTPDEMVDALGADDLSKIKTYTMTVTETGASDNNLYYIDENLNFTITSLSAGTYKILKDSIISSDKSSLFNSNIEGLEKIYGNCGKVVANIIVDLLLGEFVIKTSAMIDGAPDLTFEFEPGMTWEEFIFSDYNLKYNKASISNPWVGIFSIGITEENSIGIVLISDPNGTVEASVQENGSTTVNGMGSNSTISAGEVVLNSVEQVKSDLIKSDIVYEYSV